MTTTRLPGGSWALAAAVLVACGPRAEPAAERLNVVVVLVDTLRAANVGAYGYERPTTPMFDALAQDPASTLFLEAQAQAPCTFPSVNSILTGRVPATFIGQPDTAMGIPPEVPTLASLLATVGYDTAAVSTSPIVRATPGRMNPSGGFGAGFAAFDESCEWRPAGCVGKVARELLPGLREPFFLYLHYFDPHGPYRPPPHWRRRFAEDPWPGRPEVGSGDPLPFSRRLYDEGLDPGLSAEELAHFGNLYDDEIGFFDSGFGSLVEEWRASGLLDRTLLVVMADHGEHFLEHGHLKHCRSLYEVEIKTPLLIRIPGGSAPRRVSEPVGNLSVAPTILDLLGIEASGVQLDGPSLAPVLRNEAQPQDPVFATWGAERSVRDGRYKLIQNLATGTFELYDLEADPAEESNLAEQLPEIATKLRRRLSAWVRQHEGDASGEGADEVGQHLRSLGYL